MKHTLWIAAAAAVLIFQGCGPGEKAENKVTIEEIDGVTYVHNPAVPLHPEKTLVFEEELSIGGEDEEGNPVLFQPGIFLVDDRGYMYISEGQDQVFKVFDTEGVMVKTIGAKGSGPGEFQSIGFCGFTPDGRLLTTDFLARRTSFFDADGRFLSDFKWTRFYSRLHLTKENTYLTDEFIYGEDTSETTLLIKEIDFEGKEIRSYGEFVRPEMKRLRLGDLSLGMSVPQSPSSVFIGDRERGRLYHCLNSFYRIEMYDAEGRLTRVMDRPYTCPVFAEEDQQKFRDRYKDHPNAELKKLIRDMPFPSVKTVTERMIVDGRGYLWVITQETRKKNGITFTAADVFDLEGQYDARVWLRYIPQQLRGGKMFRLAEDEETGYRSLKRYRVIWK